MASKDYNKNKEQVAIVALALSDYVLSQSVSELEKKVKQIENRFEFLADEKTKKITSFSIAYNGLTPLCGTEKNGRENELLDEIDQMELNEWQRQLDFFLEMRQEWYANSSYRDKYVAIEKYRILDSDIDSFRLYRRIEKKYPDDVILIARVVLKDNIRQIPSSMITREI